MSMVHTARGTGRIVETQTVRGRTSHRVVAADGFSFDAWFDQTKVHTASPEDGWMPTPDSEYHDPYSEAGPQGPPIEDPAMGIGAPPEEAGFDGSFTDALQGLTEYSQTGEVGPEAMAQFAGSPDEQSILGSHHQGAPGDDVDHSNSVTLPYNPDPQHDAVNSGPPDASWGPGEYTVDADELLTPADSLSFDTKSTSEAGPYPGPAPHLFAAKGPCLGTTPHSWAWWGNSTKGKPINKYVCENCGEERDPDQMPAERQAGIAEYLFGDDEPYQAINDEDWMAQNPPPYGPLERDDAEIAERERHYQEHAVPGLDRAAALEAPRLGGKYIDVVAAADHWNDPVQQFRDDPSAFIQRRGSAYTEDSGELDRYSALIDSDAMVREGSWRDVRQKASRLRNEGKITVKDIGPDRIYATVQGDSGTYETLITKGSSLGGYDAFNSYGDQHVGNWHCSCKWGNWAFKRRFTFIGRLCSHGLASYWEMQAAHQKEDGRDPRRDKVRKRAHDDFTFNPNDRPVDRDRGLGPLIDHYGPHDKVDREHEFDRRTDLAQDYAHASDLPGDADDVPLGLVARRQADFLRTQPRGMTPTLNHIPKERDHSTVSVDSLEDIDMPGADDEGTLPDDAASVEEREAALRLGRRVVGWIADEVLPDFEQWYSANHGRSLDQARPTEATEAAADYAAERGLDQATTEMLQEFINQQFGPEDLDSQDEEHEIQHFAMAAGRYLMAATRHLADAASDAYQRSIQQPGSPQTLPDILGPALNTTSPNAPRPLTGPFGDPNGMDRGGLTPGPAGPPVGGGSSPLGAPKGSAGIDRTAPGTPGAPAAGNWWGTGAPAGGAPGGAPAAPSPGEAAGGGAPASAPIDQAAGTTTPVAGGAGSYTVKPGDTLSDIAQSQGLDGYQSLYDQNKSTIGGDPNLIQPGQQLTVPGGGGQTAPSVGGSNSLGSGLGDSTAAPAASGGGGGSWWGGGGGNTPGGAADVSSQESGKYTLNPGGSDSSSSSSPSSGSSSSAAAPATAPAGGDALTSDFMLGDSTKQTSTPTTPTKTESTAAKLSHILAGDDSLLNHLRELAQEPAAGEQTGSQSHAEDVRKTVDELRDRGYDASQLVAMVRQADLSDDPELTNPALNNPAAPKPGAALPAGATPLPTNPAPVAPSAPAAAAPSAPAASGGASTGAGGMLTAQPDASANPTPPTEGALGGTGADLPGGSQTNPSEKQKAGEGEVTEGSGGGGGGGDAGGFGADFMQMLPSIAEGVGGALGGAMSGLGDLFGGGGGGGGLGGLSDIAGGIGDAFSGILGAHFSGDGDDVPLLGEQAIDVSKVPTGFAGTGPDHQHWMSSSEDYVNEHEKDNRHDIDDFEGDILKYSGPTDRTYLEAMMNRGYQQMQANAFDQYADWGYAHSDGSANPEDWDSVESFLSQAADNEEQPAQNQAPARQVIEDRLNFTAAMNRYSGMVGLAAGAPTGYFGVGAPPRQPTADGLSHGTGAPNLKSVTKPKKVKPPHPPNLALPQLPQPQLTQQLAQPRAPMGAPQQPAGTNALGKPKRTTGGINRQGEQLQAGVLNPVFGEMGSVAGFDPGPPSQHVFAAQQNIYGAPPAMSPEQHLGGFGWDPLPGQDGTPNAVVAQQGPPDTFGSRQFAAHMSTMAPQQVPHNQAAAAAMGEYRTPNLGSYERTSDSSDVVRQFQAQMGGSDWATSYTPTGVPQRDYDLSAGANQFLSRTAGRTFSLADQARLEQESHVLGARNLDELDLSGTHYLEQ